MAGWCGATVALALFWCPPAGRAVALDDVDFERDVAPIFAMRCLECHSDGTASGDLVLTRQETLKHGGKGGEVVVEGKPEESPLFERVAAGEMPPKRQGRSQKLPEAEIRALKTWIAAGAKWPRGRTIDRDERTTAVRAGRDWWSLQGVKRPDVPATVPH